MCVYSFVYMDMRRVDVRICGDASFIAAGFSRSVRAAADGGMILAVVCVLVSFICLCPIPSMGDIGYATMLHSMAAGFFETGDVHSFECIDIAIILT